MISTTDFNQLAQATGKCLLSLYLPTSYVGREQEDRIAFKTLLQNAEKEVQNCLKTDETDELLKPAFDLLDQPEFWRNQKRTLAVFIGAGNVRIEKLRHPVNEAFFHVDEQFYLAPLVPAATGSSQDFFLLTLARENVNLFLVDQEGLQEIAVEGIIPQNPMEDLLFDTPDASLVRNGSEGSNAQSQVFSGHGAGKDRELGHLKNFLDRVDEGVRELLRNETRPLLLAGVRELIPIYHEANGYEHLVTEVYVEGNVDYNKPAELHEKAWSIMEPLLNQQQERDVEIFGQNYALDEAGTTLLTIVPAATNGRITALWLAEGARQYGKYDAATNGVTFGNEGEDGNYELFNYAAVKAMQTGARVYVVPQGTLPVPTGNACCIYRYNVDAQTTNLSTQATA